MVQMINLVNKYGLMVILILTLFVFVKSCSTSQTMHNHDLSMKAEITKSDSLLMTYKRDMVTKSDIIELNNELMREYTELFYQTQNNKISEKEFHRTLDEIRIKLINNNKQKPNK